MKPMKLAVPKEKVEGETRVALLPDDISKLTEAGNEVIVESGAGAEAGFADSDYEDAGATVKADAQSVLNDAEVVLKVQGPEEQELEGMKQGALLISFLAPLSSPELIKSLAERNVTAFAMEMIPRTTRAQSMDALSTMSTVSGYKAALIAAAELSKFFPMLTTAAGTVRPSKVLVIGAGVAGLQAIATARRLGAQVEAFDTRPVVKEQVKSLGAKFLEIELDAGDAEAEGGYARELTEEEQQKQRELMDKAVTGADAVITTALVPGKTAPVLITAETARSMRPGSVIVDLAAEAGGNCELTVPGKENIDNGVRIIGPLNLPASMPAHASQLYSRNVFTLIDYLIDEGALKLDFEDEITKGTCVTNEGRIVNDTVRAAVEGG